MLREDCSNILRLRFPFSTKSLLGEQFRKAQWAFPYCSPSMLWAENEKQLTLRFLTDVCRLLDISSSHITHISSQINGLAKRLNHISLAVHRHYAARHSRTWVAFTGALTNAYNTQPQSSTSSTLRKLVLERPTPTLALEARPAIVCNHFSQQWHLQWICRLVAVINTADKQLRDAETWYKRLFDATLRRTNDKVLPEDFVYVETTSADQPHKSASVANGSFPVVTIDPPAVTIQRLNNSLRNSRVVASEKQRLYVQILFLNLCTLLTIILVIWIYPIVAILAPSHHTATTLRTENEWLAWQI